MITPGASGWILEHEGQIIGYGELREDTGGRFVQMLRLVVDPAHRRHGLSSVLVNELVQQARASHPGWPVYTRIHQENHSALLAYPAAGLVPLEPLPDDFDEASVWLTALDDPPAIPGGPLDDA
jgi:GNAT superfamily N-acetyltransferase